MPPACAMARTAVAATGESGSTPQNAQVSTVFGGVGGSAALTGVAGCAAIAPTTSVIASAAEHAVRFGIARV